MVDIFDEVSEDLRAERAHAMFLRYRLAGIAAVIGIVAGVAGWETWQHYRARRAEAVATSFLQATERADRTGDEAAHKLAADDFARIAAKAGGGYAVLARLREAALRDDLGQHDRARALWQTVADDDHATQPLRELANLLFAQHGVDDGDAAALLSRIAPLRDHANAWHGLADETAALLDLRTGKTEDARGILTRLAADAEVSETLRARAGALLDSLGEAPSPAPTATAAQAPTAAAAQAPAATAAQAPAGSAAPAPTAANPAAPTKTSKPGG